MAHPTNGASNRFNIEKLFQLLNGTNRNVYNNKVQADEEMLEVQANIVESVIEEYNALCE